MTMFGSQWLANAGADAYEIEQSIRFNDNDLSYMQRTPGSAGNDHTYTISVWIKRSEISGPLNQDSFLGAAGASDLLGFYNDTIQFSTAGGGSLNLRSTAVFRDPGAWYHIVARYDDTQSTSTDRARVYVNGVLITAWSPATYPSQNAGSDFNTAVLHRIGANTIATNRNFDGYLAEMVMIDGTSLGPDSFGEINSDTGQWVPIDVSDLTFGTNGFHITGANSSDLGEDFSGNNNDFATTNLAATDQMSDSPTNNWCVLNSVSLTSTATLSDGNLTLSNTATGSTTGTLATPSSGKWYFEVKFDSQSAATTSQAVGVVKAEEAYITGTTGGGIYFFTTGLLRVEGDDSAGSSWGSAWGVGETIGVAIDLDANKIWFAIDNTWQASGDPSAGTDPAASGFSSEPYVALIRNGNSSRTTGWTANFGQNAFAYTPPTDFLALNSANLPAPAIDLPEKYFNTVLYEGNGGGQRVGQFQPITELYTVPNSVIFNDDDSAYLTRTPGSASNLRTWTWSAWIKRCTLSTDQRIFTANNNGTELSWRPSSGSGPDQLRFYVYSGGYICDAVTVASYKDVSAWYHVVLRVDTTQATDTNRIKIYVNGVEQTLVIGPGGVGPYPSVNTELGVNTATPHYIGRFSNGANRYVDQYMAEINFIDGQALGASSFGQLDASTNRWIPKDASGLTFGTNGFYLDMETAPGTGSGAGTDSSDNGNNWTESGLTASDQVTDSPTKNYSTWNPLQTGTNITSMSDGNLVLSGTSGAAAKWMSLGTMPVSSGKWYYEITSGGTRIGAGFTTSGSLTQANLNTGPIDVAAETFVITNAGEIYYGTTDSGNTTPAFGSGVTMGFALDADTGKAWVTVNGSNWADSSDGTSGDPVAGTNPTWTQTIGTPVQPLCGDTSGGSFVTLATANFGQSAFAYTPPTGYNAWNNDNLPLSDNGISSFVWIKNRDAADNHMLFDVVRGATKDLHSNLTSAEVTNPNTLTRFLINGFEVGSDVEVNTNGESYVAWQWSEGATPGFDIVSYSGTGANRTVAHNLGVKPGMFIVKQRGAASTNWGVYHSAVGATKSLFLQSTGAAFDSAEYFNDTEPTSSVFTLGTNAQGNADGGTYIAYVFAPVEGFSAFGSYAGNSSTNGPMVNLGFRPAFLICKVGTGSTGSWRLFDTTRNPSNVTNKLIYPNLSNAEATSAELDILSNGFKIRVAGGYDINDSGDTIVYMAFAENPFKTANAR